MSDKESQRVLIVAAHPDDEVIGCGGTIARHTDIGDDVRIVILADGETSRSRGPDTNKIIQREEAARQASQILGVKHIEFLRLPDNRLDGLERLDLIKLLEKLIDSYRPNIVYTHHWGDLNVDHRRAFESVVTSCRPFPSQCVEYIFSFEVPSSTDWMSINPTHFQPNWFQDIGSTVERKKEAIEVYISEMRPWPHARSTKAIDHLARWRGASVGCEAAEAFQLIRAVMK